VTTTRDGAFCPSEDPGCAIGRRRRGEQLERAILEAALAQLAEHGLGALTMEGVAGAARTGKASLYRRWSSKEDLILDALDRVMPNPEDAASTGSLRGDVLRQLTQIATFVSGPSGAVMRSLLAEVEPDGALLTALRTRLIEPRLLHLTGLIERGVDRGEARPGSATTVLAQVGPAVLIHRFLLAGRVTEADVLEVVDEIVLPLLQRGCQGSGLPGRAPDRRREQ
jgi:AcrR family transcriptional regulator